MASNPLAFHEIAELTLSCICTSMDEFAMDESLAYPGCPCRAFVSPGEPILDACCDDCSGVPGGNHGLLAVYVEDVYPYQTFPARSVESRQCAPTGWAAVVNITSARCVPGQDDQGKDPSVDGLQEAARRIEIDRYSIYSALQCCMTLLPATGKNRRRLVILASQKLPEAAGCSGVKVRAVIDAGVQCPCEGQAS